MTKGVKIAPLSGDLTVLWFAKHISVKCECDMNLFGKALWVSYLAIQIQSCFATDHQSERWYDPGLMKIK